MWTFHSMVNCRNHSNLIEVDCKQYYDSKPGSTHVYSAIYISSNSWSSTRICSSSRQETIKHSIPHTGTNCIALLQVPVLVLERAGTMDNIQNSGNLINILKYLKTCWCVNIFICERYATQYFPFKGYNNNRITNIIYIEYFMAILRRQEFWIQPYLLLIQL